MTAVLEPTFIPDTPASLVTDVIKRMDELVDDHYHTHPGLEAIGGRTCLLGLVGYALYGTDWTPNYFTFDPSVNGRYYKSDPLAIAVVDYIASHIPGDLGPSYEKVYKYNDTHLKSARAVHAFLQRVA